jgi:hypothetical protein
MRSADSLECLDDFELLAVEVDVGPAQSEQFTAAQSEVQRQDVERVRPVRGGSAGPRVPALLSARD